MKIAVCYDEGNIFQHFGKTEQFKIYEAENGEIRSAQVIASNGAGHGALANVLSEQGVNVLICGGMGEGARQALEQAGIEIYSGAQGSADEAVAAYLKGELVSAGVNCDHHHDESHECGGDCGDGCESGGCGGGCGDGCESGGCGGGCGGCGGAPRLTMEGKNAGKTVKVHYKGTLNDGTQFDSSYDRGEPLEFVCAAGMMIRGFDAAVVNMEVGESVDIHLMPEEAYGDRNPNAMITVPLEALPGAEELNVGEQVYLSNAMGQPFLVRVAAKDEQTITFDANHEMAGKELNFHIELLSAE